MFPGSKAFSAGSLSYSVCKDYTLTLPLPTHNLMFHGSKAFSAGSLSYSVCKDYTLTLPLPTHNLMFPGSKAFRAGSLGQLVYRVVDYTPTPTPIIRACWSLTVRHSVLAA